MLILVGHASAAHSTAQSSHAKIPFYLAMLCALRARSILCMAAAGRL